VTLSGNDGSHLADPGSLRWPVTLRGAHFADYLVEAPIGVRESTHGCRVRTRALETRMGSSRSSGRVVRRADHGKGR
jgi:hypothetical protein